MNAKFVVVFAKSVAMQKKQHNKITKCKAKIGWCWAESALQNNKYTLVYIKSKSKPAKVFFAKRANVKQTQRNQKLFSGNNNAKAKQKTNSLAKPQNKNKTTNYNLQSKYLFVKL